MPRPSTSRLAADPQFDARLRAAMRDVIEKAVYWDDDFVAGNAWFEQIKRYIDKSPQLFAFWSVHSSQSKQVQREFMYALEKERRVVPVLLDHTPLVPRLVAILGVDLRSLIYHRLPERFEGGPVLPEDFSHVSQSPGSSKLQVQINTLVRWFAPYFSSPSNIKPVF